MIRQLKGTVLSCTDNALHLDMGVFGLSVTVPHAQSFTPGSLTILQIHLEWHQELGPHLYGFKTETERTVFLVIITCHGVGPKLGITMLESMSPSAIVRALTQGDTKALSNISGIGKKKAEQMIVALKHKADNLVKAGIIQESASEATSIHELSQALAALHYTRSEITSVLERIHREQVVAGTFDQLLRKALSYLSQTR